MGEMAQREIADELDWDVADKLRKALRFADVSVGEMADYLGVNRNTVGRWINGHTPADYRTLRLWALRCGVPLDWLTEARSVAKRPHYATEIGLGSSSNLTADEGPHVDGRTQVDAELLELAKRIPMRARAAVAS